MAKHEVLKTVLHGTGSGKNSRKVYRKGSVIDLDPEDAQPLIDAGHLAPAGNVAEDSKPLDRLNLAELKDKAAAANVSIAEGATKKQIIEALAAAGVTE